MRWHTQLLRSACLLCGLLFKLASSSRTNSNYNVYKYDDTVPQFTPDGRLLQVEYASGAADHSAPVVAAAISDDLLLMCTTSARRSIGVYQERLVLVPTGNMARTTVSDMEEYVVVALSGVLADSLALLEAVQEERFSQQRTYGESGSNIPARVARTIADQCQRHAFGGGLRPFGATLLICGVNDDGISLYRTDPSGSILESPSFCSRIDGSTSSSFEVVGGGSLARTLKQRLASCRASNDKKRIGEILSLVHEEQVRAQGTDGKKGYGLQLEAVLVSRTRGALKLSNEQIESFLQRKRNYW